MRPRMPVLAAISVGVAVFLGSVSAAPAEDATALGYPVQGASLGALSADAVRGTRFAATADTTIGTVRAYLAGNGTPQTVSASVYIGFPFGDGPNRLVGRSEPQTVSLVGGRWVDFTLTTGAHLQAGRSYYILVHSGGQDGGLSIAYETGRTEPSLFVPLPFPTMPDPFRSSAVVETSTRTYSVYAVADASLPESLSPPAVSGPATAGPGAHVLSVSNGSWRSDTGLTYAYQWQACHPDTITNFADSWCDDIAGATGQTLTVTPVPLTTRFRAVVTARNDVARWPSARTCSAFCRRRRTSSGPSSRVTPARDRRSPRASASGSGSAGSRPARAHTHVCGCSGSVAWQTRAPTSQARPRRQRRYPGRPPRPPMSLPQQTSGARSGRSSWATATPSARRS